MCWSRWLRQEGSLKKEKHHPHPLLREQKSRLLRPALRPLRLLLTLVSWLDIIGLSQSHRTSNNLKLLLYRRDTTLEKTLARKSNPILLVWRDYCSQKSKCVFKIPQPRTGSVISLRLRNLSFCSWAPSKIFSHCVENKCCFWERDKTEVEQFPGADRGERESLRCVNVFFQSINLSVAQPQKQRRDKKRARITQTKFANGQLDPPGPPALVEFTHASLSLTLTLPGTPLEFEKLHLRVWELQSSSILGQKP